MEDEQKKPWWASRSNRMRLWLGLLAVLGLAGAAFGLWLLRSGEDDDGGASVTLDEGQAAPDFSLAEAGGGTASLTDFRGQKVLLYFSMGSG